MPAVLTGLTLFVLTLSLASGQECLDIVDNLEAIFRDPPLVELFPKDYEVWLHVAPSDLNSTSCVWTVLALLQDDWSALSRNLWNGQENQQKVDWIVKGLKELKLPHEDEDCVKKELVSDLINVTLQSLRILRSNNCSGCNGTGHGLCQGKMEARGRPQTTPMLEVQTPGTPILWKMPRRTQPPASIPQDESIWHEAGVWPLALWAESRRCDHSSLTHQWASWLRRGRAQIRWGLLLSWLHHQTPHPVPRAVRMMGRALVRRGLRPACLLLLLLGPSGRELGSGVSGLSTGARGQGSPVARGGVL